MAPKYPKEVDRHHRRPRSRGGTDHPDNISIVRRADHKAYHRLFGNMLADEIAAMLTDTWIDSDYYLVAVRRHKKQPKRRRKRRYCVNCEAEVLKFIPKTEPEK
jgi:hypothetical protein